MTIRYPCAPSTNVIYTTYSLLLRLYYVHRLERSLHKDLKLIYGVKRILGEKTASPGGGLAKSGGLALLSNRQGHLAVPPSISQARLAGPGHCLRGCIRLSKNMISTLDGSETDPPNVASYVRPRFKLSPSEVGLLASALTNMFD